ncbi:S9 family peptidase [Thalassotalea agarivorans]|uniref:Dipeptidyl aminopeptidase/acylaminoacyl peptidase n=1 Tax=Thalassotalea agarivorans TaxID=349064 RepID=A0A1I0E6I3_THASX|nr:DPP IV N-terminal domain-containing protein [Thalassotalea agarivorans]SET40800.1 Dipeptidyl aminopeptidase/acylaminoacyl peptidase [Thalassotalea agarivorans]
MLKQLYVTALASFIAAHAVAKDLTVEDYKRAENQLNSKLSKYVDQQVLNAHWSKNGVLTLKMQEQAQQRFYTVDVNTGVKQLAFDHQKLATALAKAAEKDIAADKIPARYADFIDNTNVALSITGTRFICDTSAYQCAKDGNAVSKKEFLSPDGKKAVFIREHNLWMRTLADNKEVQLTRDGIEDFGYGTNNAGWITSEKPVLLWSPDSSKIATFKHDSRNVGTMSMASTNVGHPTLHHWKYPLPGDEHIFKITRVVVDVTNAKVTKLDMPADDHRSTITDHVAGWGGEFLDVYWAQDSAGFAFVSSSRDHKKATLRLANANTGKVTTLFTETEETFFESGVDGISWRYLDKSDEILWFSQRDDWGHLYLFDAKSGKLKRQITQGEWTVREVLHVDQASGDIVFTGAGKEGGDPYYQYLYKVNKSGDNLTLLTPEKLHHRVVLNKETGYFVDRMSTPQLPEVVKLRHISGKTVGTIAEMDISALTATGWKAPENFVVKDRDGNFDLYGLVFKPHNFDASKSYPVVNYLYPGPQVGSVRGRHFNIARRDHQALAELGFVVVVLDALGTPGRSKSFHEFYYGNMGDSGIPDQVAAIKQLAKERPYMDLNRVGIWGHSGGGFASTRALLLFPDFFKVAVSQAGNHDNRNYADEWGEKWHGMLVNNEDGTTNYDSQANQLIAKNLKGKLLIAHGTLDTNVPHYSSLLVVDALIAANKDFDMLMLPNRGHGFANEPYMMRKRWDYFVQHLMGVNPPKEFSFGE